MKNWIWCLVSLQNSVRGGLVVVFVLPMAAIVWLALALSQGRGKGAGGGRVRVEIEAVGPRLRAFFTKIRIRHISRVSPSLALVAP